MKTKLLCAVMFLAFAAGSAVADNSSNSYVGVLTNPDNGTGTFDSTDAFILDLMLNTSSDVTLQTYGFGGGTNQAGNVIAPGGTDPFVSMFSGTGDSAVFLNGTSLTQTNYTPGCPPAGTVSDFGDTTCGDVRLTFTDLAAGSYIVLLSDGQYVPAAADGAGTTFGDGAFDLTGGVFCNAVDVDTNTACPNTSGAWALDVITADSSGTTTTPEPGTLLLLGGGLAGLAGIRKRRED